MSKKGYSRQGFFGDIHHYDENGHKTGTSRPGLFGGYTNYDSHGNKTGHSDPGFFGGYNHYDNHGKKIGHSDPSLFGGYNHYDSNNKSTGSSDPSMFGGYNHSSSGGCYIATCVYGSYDCPEVWTLRRFRDNTLATNIFGRAFIKTYYSISPTLVKWFGNTTWFKKLWKTRLDKMVSSLKNKGVDDTPYEDKYVTFITGMAMGTDIWAAEIVLERKKTNKDLHLICALPHPNFECRRSMVEKMRFNKIIKKADLVKEINDHYFTGCYQVRNEWMVDRSNLVIAVFNGQKSGTKNTVDYAMRKGVSIVNILKKLQSN